MNETKMNYQFYVWSKTMSVVAQEEAFIFIHTVFRLEFHKIINENYNYNTLIHHNLLKKKKMYIYIWL